MLYFDFSLSLSFLPQVEQNWATLQGGEMTIQTTQASEATQAVASLAEAAVAASQEMQQGATVTMALNRWRQGWGEGLQASKRAAAFLLSRLTGTQLLRHCRLGCFLQSWGWSSPGLHVC